MPGQGLGVPSRWSGSSFVQFPGNASDSDPADREAPETARWKEERRPLELWALKWSLTQKRLETSAGVSVHFSPFSHPRGRGGGGVLSLSLSFKPVAASGQRAARLGRCSGGAGQAPGCSQARRRQGALPSPRGRLRPRSRGPAWGGAARWPSRAPLAAPVPLARVHFTLRGAAPPSPRPLTEAELGVCGGRAFLPRPKASHRPARRAPAGKLFR